MGITFIGSEIFAYENTKLNGHIIGSIKKTEFPGAKWTITIKEPLSGIYYSVEILGMHNGASEVDFSYDTELSIPIGEEIMGLIFDVTLISGKMLLQCWTDNPVTIKSVQVRS